MTNWEQRCLKIPNVKKNVGSSLSERVEKCSFKKLLISTINFGILGTVAIHVHITSIPLFLLLRACRH
jgi:hypothetical protein